MEEAYWGKQRPMVVAKSLTRGIVYVTFPIGVANEDTASF